jgi:RNA polymerase sigma-70 factor (ECF subfamily)
MPATAFRRRGDQSLLRLPTGGAVERWGRLRALEAADPQSPTERGSRVAVPVKRPDDCNDGELMAAIAEGNVPAFEELYERHSGVVLATCIRILRDRPEAEDVLEEIFFEVWKRRDRYDASRAAPLSYLLTLSRSRALDRLRFRRRREGVWLTFQEAGPIGEMPSAAGPGTDPFDDALALQRRAAIERALEELPESHRRAVELNFFEGLSHREIAERLGDPLGTVKTRIRQGLLALRKTLRALREGTGTP